eukprot:CAMPEP_0197679522 /NCGR_PEP_ID=MMETSP1338-20131121/91814_1 /TAXON_ID=43686 ORGANISM="Pelagodinium beii, Strain RCC1491" /NCGR_SAMPLE_ID=MMETSP1338 /ASSEMBLY_ACC=CAM_ASM_000754 /LENGTH=73 /DNA_ID=CAMNT_0043260581 /DNA_START=615 /DNA_END=836 /DNA_ORIENTATION=-
MADQSSGKSASSSAIEISASLTLPSLATSLSLEPPSKRPLAKCKLRRSRTLSDFTTVFGRFASGPGGAAAAAA